jgi:hypothetical protein
VSSLVSSKPKETFWPKSLKSAFDTDKKGGYNDDDDDDTTPLSL